MIIKAQQAQPPTPEYFKHNGIEYDILFKSTPSAHGHSHMVLNKRYTNEDLYFALASTGQLSDVLQYNVARTSPQAAQRMISTLAALIAMSPSTI
jgi:hypothetical protein